MNSSRSNSRWVSTTGSSRERHLARSRVDPNLPDDERLGLFDRTVDAPQHRVDARHQLGRRERLDDVVVGAQPQSDHAI